MLACNETITLVQHIAEKDKDRYECHVIHGVSWYGKSKVELQEHGLAAAKEVKIRVPIEHMPEGITPQEGDFVVRGLVSGIKKPAELIRYEFVKIMVVSDNRRGRLPHWGVTGNESRGKG